MESDKRWMFIQGGPIVPQSRSRLLQGLEKNIPNKRFRCCGGLQKFAKNI